MKKRISAILVLALCVSLCGCGKSRLVQSVEEAISSLGKISLLSFEAIEEAEKMYDALSDEEKESVENISDLRDAREKYDFLAFTASNRPFSYEWINSADGDIYVFECTGEGTHDNVPCTYTRSEDENNMAIIVSEDGVEENVTLRLELGGRTELVTDTKRYPYVRRDDYEAAGAEVRAEVEKYLLAQDNGIWVIANQFMVFGENGEGIVFDSFENLSNSKYSTMKWEYIDNDTIRIRANSSGGNYSVTGDFSLLGDAAQRPILLNHRSKTTACGSFITWEELTAAG